MHSGKCTRPFKNCVTLLRYGWRGHSYTACSENPSQIAEHVFKSGQGKVEMWFQLIQNQRDDLNVPCKCAWSKHLNSNSDQTQSRNKPKPVNPVWFLALECFHLLIEPLLNHAGKSLFNSLNPFIFVCTSILNINMDLVLLLFWSDIWSETTTSN